jgi:hypothetical protein
MHEHETTGSLSVLHLRTAPRTSLRTFIVIVELFPLLMLPACTVCSLSMSPSFKLHMHPAHLNDGLELPRHRQSGSYHVEHRHTAFDAFANDG